MGSSKKKTTYEVDKDKDHKLQVSKRFQAIPADPASEFKRATLAAGAVLWRGDAQDPGNLEVAVIHRPHYDDWSLAKGKLDPGETLPVTAAREILEETGYEVRLGKLLGKVTYPVAGRTKVVYYWTGEVLDGTFTPNDEVDELRWLSFAKAKKLLSYDVDREVLAKAEKRFSKPATSRVLYVRHAKAHKRGAWAGDDNLRPLDKKGRRQAEMLVPMLSAFTPQRIYTALPDRCQSTVEPLGDELGIDLKINKLLGDDALTANFDKAQQAFHKVASKPGVSVVCSQGAMMPAILQWLSKRDGLTLGEIEVKKAGVWVLSFNEGTLTGADYIASPLPVK